MQTVIWAGQGDGTFGVPFLLQKPENFDIEAAFNILITVNFIAPQPETAYFRFSDSLTKFTLAHIISSRDSLIYIETRNAIKVTLFLTDKVNYLDGAFQVLTHNGNQFISKQQIFDPKRAEFVGFYRGLWVSKAFYGKNDAVMYDDFLYVAIEESNDTVFDHNKWINVSGIEVISIDRDPTNEDFSYALGTMWINTVTYDHFVLVRNDIDQAIWNPNSDPIVVGTYEEIIEGTDTESKSWSATVLKESIQELSTKVFTQDTEPIDYDDDDIWFDTSS